MRPFIIDPQGIVRFKANAIVLTLLEESRKRGFGLNQLSLHDFTQADWEEFYALMGYSLCGFHELSEVSDETAREATRAAQAVMPEAKGCRDTGCEIHCGVPRTPR